jgi:hypothetical protein
VSLPAALSSAWRQRAPATSPARRRRAPAPRPFCPPALVSPLPVLVIAHKPLVGVFALGGLMAATAAAAAAAPVVAVTVPKWQSIYNLADSRANLPPSLSPVPVSPVSFVFLCGRPAPALDRRRRDGVGGRFSSCHRRRRQRKGIRKSRERRNIRGRGVT